MHRDGQAGHAVNAVTGNRLTPEGRQRIIEAQKRRVCPRTQGQRFAASARAVARRTMEKEATYAEGGTGGGE